ncbi:MAG: hypothetical protein IJG50_05945 [Clostridia bacterium]|nr:hypothetical protein [Clostridia bacterium]
MKKALIFTLLAAFFLITMPSCTVNINNTDNADETGTDSAAESEESFVKEINASDIMTYEISDDGVLTVSMKNDSGDPDSIWYYTATEGSEASNYIEITSAENSGTGFTSHFSGVSDGNVQLIFNLSRDDVLYKVASLDVTVSGGIITEAKNAAVTEFSTFTPPDISALTPDDSEFGNETAPVSHSLLPPYFYSGSDEYLGVICAYMTMVYAPDYDGDVQIPAPVIYKMDDSDPEYLKVWGRFLIDSYVLNGHTLEINKSGEVLGLFTLHKTPNGFETASFDTVSDGYDKNNDIRRICEGDESLVNRFHKSHESDLTAARIDYVSAYVFVNSLAIDRYKDQSGEEHMLVGVPVIED